MKVKKMIAPIIITALIVIYLSVFIFRWSTIHALFWIKIAGILIPLFFLGVSIFVLIERLREIKGGEEDDISKY
jgi:hypothetical protein